MRNKPECALSEFEQTAVSHIESVGFTVSDMNRAIDFYTRILPFEKISDEEVGGAEIENLSGVSGAKIRVSRLQLGGEILAGKVNSPKKTNSRTKREILCQTNQPF